MKLKRGDQVAYIPPHVHIDQRIMSSEAALLARSDVQLGFVTAVHPREPLAFCRYWQHGKPGALRTTSCSELAATENLIKLAPGIVDQWIVDLFLIRDDAITFIESFDRADGPNTRGEYSDAAKLVRRLSKIGGGL